jgi:hypothetical protein
MRGAWVWVVVATVLLAFGCGESENPPSSQPSGGTGGTAGATGSGGALGTSGTSGAAGTAGSSTMGSAGMVGNGGMVGTGGAAGSGGTGGNVTDLPIILSFSAEPPNLPNGGGMTTLSWKVSNADSLSIDQGVGTVTGESSGITVRGTTIFTLTATNGNGSVSASTAVVTGQNPARDGGRYVAMVSPTNGESFLAPSSLRLVAAARDPNVYTNSPRDGLGGNASKVQFFVDDSVVAEVDGSTAEYWMFKGRTEGVTAGVHRVWARAIYVNPARVLDSVPALITVGAPGAYERVVDLTADVVLSGSTAWELSGTPDKRARLNANGFRIRSSSGASGALTLRHVDVFDLGSRSDSGQAGIDVTTTGTVTIEDSGFDSSNSLRFSLGGSATASIRRNTFRSNSRLPVGQQPAPPSTFPVVTFTGGSTGEKVFAGNNVGAGFVEFSGAKNWIVGGASDQDQNVLIGPRVGIHVGNSADVRVVRNYSHHRYFGGWSQGDNFELQGSPSAVVEHNVIFGSSWPVRGVGCEFRYNLVLDAGHQWLWAAANGSIHHNVFIGGDADVGGIYVLYDAPNVRFFNNTIDGLLGNAMVTAIKLQSGALTAHSNAFLNVPRAPTVAVEGGMLTADYNAFFNPQTTHYSDGRKPAHDLSGTDAKLADPPDTLFDLDEAAIWKRTLTTANVLSAYRARYTPQPTSPLIDSGDPQAGGGNDIGAIGAGQPNGADLFGRQ